jgi:hypothetical protein
MVSSVLWVIGLALESTLLVRAVVGNFLKHYTLFYLYLLSVLLRSASLLAVYHWWPNFYLSVYWYSQFLNVLLGCALVWEVYKIALSRYPGAARMARNVLPFLFIFAITRVFVKAWNSPNWIPGRTALETERDLRIVQGVLLLSLVVLFLYYAIPLGRNLKGIVGGYSLFVLTSIVHLTLRDYLGDNFQHLWQYIQPFSYVSVLLVWCVTLWSYAPNPKPETEPQLQEDYQSLVRATRRRLNSARAYLHRGMRP